MLQRVHIRCQNAKSVQQLSTTMGARKRNGQRCWLASRRRRHPSSRNETVVVVDGAAFANIPTILAASAVPSHDEPRGFDPLAGICARVRVGRFRNAELFERRRQQWRRFATRPEDAMQHQAVICDLAPNRGVLDRRRR